MSKRSRNRTTVRRSLPSTAPSPEARTPVDAPVDDATSPADATTDEA